MPLPHFEVPSGVIDGANLVFNVSQAYKPGTTAVFLNGLLLRADYDDGWTESDPATGEITLKEPPRVTKITPDVVQVFYIDLSPDVLEAIIVCRLEGRLTAVDDLEGHLVALTSLRGSVDVSGGLEGFLEPGPGLRGELDVHGAIEGHLKEVC
jgi:hypothetical protein